MARLYIHVVSISLAKKNNSFFFSLYLDRALSWDTTTEKKLHQNVKPLVEVSTRKWLENTLSLYFLNGNLTAAYLKLQPSLPLQVFNNSRKKQEQERGVYKHNAVQAGKMSYARKKVIFRTF